ARAQCQKAPLDAAEWGASAPPCLMSTVNRMVRSARVEGDIEGGQAQTDDIDQDMGGDQRRQTLLPKIDQREYRRDEKDAQEAGQRSIRAIECEGNVLSGEAEGHQQDRRPGASEERNKTW